MGLEDAPEGLMRVIGCGMQGGCDLCGMMRVVIDNGDTTDGSLVFKSAVRAREAVKCGSGNSTIDRQQIG